MWYADGMRPGSGGVGKCDRPEVAQGWELVEGKGGEARFGGDGVLSDGRGTNEAER